MVHGELENEEIALDAAFKADLFENRDDADGAIAEEADENDIKQFSEWKCCHEV